MLSLIVLIAPSTLILGGMVADGTGAEPVRADVRIVGNRIAAIGRLRPQPGETVVQAKGLIVAPGFIDAHSHADGGIEQEPLAKSQVSQGITTAVVGQDGGWRSPVQEQFTRLERLKPAINFAAFSGLGGIRGKVLGEDYKRPATLAEVSSMQALVETDMIAGALGVSTGLEYDPGYYATTDELIRLSRAAGRYKGMAISHVRDEGNGAMVAFEELARIGREAGLHAQISHIKLCAKGVWDKAGDACALLDQDQMTADVYPFTFWQSSVSALTPSREWEKREIWVKALEDVDGPQNVRITEYTHEPSWVGKTLAQLSTETGRDAIDLIQEILSKTAGPGASGAHGVAVQAMSEADLETFLRHPRIMISSDGSIAGTHPRSAGSFPRVLGRYVRERKVIPLGEAIRKMTQLPAKTFGLRDRGLLRKGLVADLVVFDPARVADRATADNPRALSVGIRDVFVCGVAAWRNGRSTGARNGRILRRSR